MTFHTALYKMIQCGEKIKMPEWGGYWYWDKEKRTIIIHTKEGKEFDIRDTDDVAYTFGFVASDNWIIATEDNTIELGAEEHLFGFDTAIRELKRGHFMARKGWNGKGMFIYMTERRVVNAMDESDPVRKEVAGYFYNKGITKTVINGNINLKTANDCITVGWVPSQEDLLAEDWCFVDDTLKHKED